MNDITKKLKTSKEKSHAFYRQLSKKKKIGFWIALILILFFLLGRKEPDIRKGYDFEQVKRSDIVEKVNESGNVVTAGRTEIFSPSDGIVQEMYVQNGDIVTFGQKLFKVKSTATEAERAAAYANLASAQSALKTAEQTKTAYQAALEQARQGVIESQSSVNSLYDNRNNGKTNPSTGKSYTQLEIDSVESSLTSSRLSFNTNEKKYLEADVAIQAAKAQVSSTSLAYNATRDSVVKSSTIGTVANISAEPGESVTATKQLTSVSLEGTVTSSNAVLTIANFSTNGIKIQLNETDISKVKVDQPVEIVPDALIESTYIGRVKRVDDISATENGVVLYAVYIDIENPDEKLRSGMSVDVDIEVSKKEDALSVSNSAVKPYQGGRAVQVLSKNGELEYVKVKIGTRGEKRTEILEGLTEGQEIISGIKNEKIKRNSIFGG